MLKEIHVEHTTCGPKIQWNGEGMVEAESAVLHLSSSYAYLYTTCKQNICELLQYVLEDTVLAVQLLLHAVLLLTLGSPPLQLNKRWGAVTQHLSCKWNLYTTSHHCRP